MATQPTDVQELLAGYAAGFNAYLADTPSGDLPEWCAGQSWVRPISAVDLNAYWSSLALYASGAQLLDFIATAQPPTATPAGTANGAPSSFPDFRSPGGSNGWAIGRDRSESGGGMLLANPHFPWEGDLRLWENHLTIPGELDIYGASLIGLAGVQVGFNEHIAWTHTVSTTARFTVYTLDLVPGDPTAYLYDGAPRSMTARDFTVKVRETDGSTSDFTRRLYFSHYGPIFNYPAVGWTPALTLTFRDGNLDDDRSLYQWLGMDRARSLAELQQAQADVQGINWVNTIASAPDGTVWYAESSTAPSLSSEAIAAWEQARLTDPLTSVAYDLLGVVLLNGSRSLFEWVDAPGARAPGLLPFSAKPQLQRTDYVFNANDSHWLTNPAALLEGYSPMLGLERTRRSPRTRRNALTLSDVSSTGPAGADGRFSFAELQNTILGNRGVIAELLKDAVVARCTGAAPVSLGDETLDLSTACGVLTAWDGRSNLGSAGAPLWREFVTSFGAEDLAGAPDGILFAEPFDPADPLGTPAGLAPSPTQGDDPILQHLAMAVHHLQTAGFPLDATLGELQFSVRDPGHTPIHGGTNGEGMENVVEVGIGGKTSLEPEPPIGPPIDGSFSLTADGYPIAFGSSFLLALEYREDGPRAGSILTYSESGDPRSPHYADQGELFSRKQWKPVAFTEAEITADPALTTTIVGHER